MEQTIKKAWIEALNSGLYKQGKEYLLANEKYCCLGVLCDIYIKDNQPALSVENFRNDNQDELPNDTIMNWSQLTARQVNELVYMNDEGIPFSEIAEYIECHL